MEPGRFRALTFDCYGTLVDWRRGQREALAALPACAGLGDRRLGEIETARMAAEQELEAGPFLPYAEVLARSLASAAADLGLELPADQALAFAAAQPRWPAFADSVAALRRLGRGRRLGLLSNSDAAPLAATAVGVLDGAAEALVSAEEVRAYKPAPAHWEEALRRLELPAAEVLHVSAYPYYDLEPAHALGIPVAYVQRDARVTEPTGLPLVGAWDDLAALADALGARDEDGTGA